jgi:hypothetical protein
LSENLEEIRRKADEKLRDYYSPEARIERKKKRLMQQDRHKHDVFMSNLYVKEWEKFYKKIPKRGLNNLTKEPKIIKWQKEQGNNPIPWNPKPTLPKRLNKILPVWGLPSTPPFKILALASLTDESARDAIPEIRKITLKCIDALNNLYDKMDSVTVLPQHKVEYYKEQIELLKFDILKKSWYLGEVIE